jgi:hypothetical protein
LSFLPVTFFFTPNPFFPPGAGLTLTKNLFFPYSLGGFHFENKYIRILKPICQKLSVFLKKHLFDCIFRQNILKAIFKLAGLCSFVAFLLPNPFVSRKPV